jgi:hypothetical protein
VSIVVENVLKPRGALCKISALMRWTGWSETYIYELVKDNRLEVWRLRANSKPMYYVGSAQAILDGKQ